MTMALTISRTLPTNLILAKGKEYQKGLGAALLTTFMWASWMISVKLGSESALTAFDLAIVRYGMPALFFSYFTFKARNQLKTVPWPILIGLCLGAGVPFFFLGSLGMDYAPVSHAGLLLPGTFPLFVTGIAVVFYREALSRNRLVGLIAISFGVVILLLQSVNGATPDLWKGDLIFLLASFFWAIFSVCVRLAGLNAFVVTGLFGSVSTIILLFLFLIGAVDSGVDFSLATAPLGYYAVQFLIQGILVGLVASIGFSFAIARIGAENTTAIGSLTPVVAILLAFPVLGEIPTFFDILAMSLVCFGVIRASGVKIFK